MFYKLIYIRLGIRFSKNFVVNLPPNALELQMSLWQFTQFGPRFCVTSILFPLMTLTPKRELKNWILL